MGLQLNWMKPLASSIDCISTIVRGLWSSVSMATAKDEINTKNMSTQNLRMTDTSLCFIVVNPFLLLWFVLYWTLVYGWWIFCQVQFCVIPLIRYWEPAPEKVHANSRYVGRVKKQLLSRGQYGSNTVIHRIATVLLGRKLPRPKFSELLYRRLLNCLSFCYFYFFSWPLQRAPVH